jgi:hypothetical protein
MSSNNPQVERFTIWGFTYEEILHRWSIWKKFDLIARAFGDGSKPEKPEPPPITNSNETFAALANIFGADFMKPAPEETVQNGEE